MHPYEEGAAGPDHTHLVDDVNPLHWQALPPLIRAHRVTGASHWQGADDMQDGGVAVHPKYTGLMLTSAECAMLREILAQVRVYAGPNPLVGYPPHRQRCP